jgi:hypothetical protein
MDDLDTTVYVIQLLMEGLNYVVEGRVDLTISIPASVTHFAGAQEKVGWNPLMKGHLDGGKTTGAY